MQLERKPLYDDDFHEHCQYFEDGDYYVYAWEDDDENIFYVGSGEGYRYRDKNARSDEFKQYISKRKCRPLIVAFGLDKDGARSFEARLITEYRNLGFPLLNAEKCGRKTDAYRAAHKSEYYKAVKEYKEKTGRWGE